MAHARSNSDDHDGGKIFIHPSDTVPKDDKSPPGNEIIEEQRSNDSGAEADDDVHENVKENKHLDTEPKGSPRKVEDKKSPHQNGNVSMPNSSRVPTEATGVLDRGRGPEAALNEIKTQTTHALYCSICKINITKEAVLFVKGQETDRYKTQPFVLWIPLVIPSFLLSWFRRLSSPAPVKPIQHESVPAQVVVNPIKPSDPEVVDPIEPSVPKVVDPIQRTPIPEGKWKRYVPNCPTFLRFLLVVVLLLLSVILLWPQPFPPHPDTNENLKNITPDPQKTPENHTESDVTDVLGDVKPPSPPQPIENSTDIENKGHLISLSWVIYFPSIKFFSAISLLLLAILALSWHSIPWIEISKQIQVVFNVHVLPNNGGEAQETVISLARNLVRLPEVLWEHIVVPVQNLLPRELDILKSIVYGGLIESITSLGVVSSAAASGVSTLNVLALGVANLFSGLFLILHNLNGLISKQPRSQSANSDHMTSVEAEDPYQTLLGKRRKVNLHYVVVLVSFVVFGVIPPIFYALTFQKTDKRHYKAAVVLAASLICVISLSFAKAYAFGMRKLRTVAEYTGMAIGASAFSFIFSQFFSDLLEKCGFHELASDYRKG